MGKSIIPIWLQKTTFTGREDGEEGTEGEGSDEGTEGEGEGDGEEGEGEGSEDESGSTPTEAEVKLKKALRQERALRRSAEREAKELKKKKADEASSEAETKTTAELEAEKTKTSKLAAKLLKNELESAVKAEAKRLKFIDPSDALIDDVLKEIDAHQDEDDPSDIDIDVESVKSAVKALADKKKHLIEKPTDGQPSGGKFGSKGGTKDGQKTSDDKLKEAYPSLR